MRKMEQANNLYYLKSDEKERESNFKDIPIQNIDLQVSLNIPGLASSDKYLEVKKGKERKIKKKKTSKKSSKSTYCLCENIMRFRDLVEPVFTSLFERKSVFLKCFHFHACFHNYLNNLTSIGTI